MSDTENLVNRHAYIQLQNGPNPVFLKQSLKIKFKPLNTSHEKQTA